jgi:formylglycine-generating enzyme required for sulfatase activity
MGSAEYSDEELVHTVYLDAFWIDRTEVTNAQFVGFLNERGNREEGGVTWLDIEDEDCLIEEAGGGYRARSGHGDHPVIEVSWYGAAAYCAWAGGRLPTEAEWEKAARGTDGRTYPWGNDFECSLGNFDDETEIDDYVVPGGAGCDGHNRTAPVGSYPGGASPYGALDMAGNVWEWVADWYDSGYYSRSPGENPQGPASGEYRGLRGGSWDYARISARSAYRNWYYPDSRFYDFGFRCVVSPTSSP